MTQVIWKAALAISDIQQISAPQGAKILYFGNQNETPTVWFLCDPKAPRVVGAATVRLIGTGHETAMFDNDDWRFVGTAAFEGGALVLHLFVKQ